MDVACLFGCVPTWVWLVALVLALFYVYIQSPYRILTRLGIPGPKPEMMFGNFRHLEEQGIIEQMVAWRREYGDVYGIYLGRLPVLVINDLDILKEILVKDFQHFADRWVSLPQSYVENGVFFQSGADWKRTRNIVTPTFSSGKLKLMVESINKCGEMLSHNLVMKAKKKETVDVKHYFGAYTMDVIATTAFSLELDSQTNHDEPFAKNARKLFDQANYTTAALALSFIFPFLNKVLRFIKIGFFPTDPVEFFVKSIRAMIEQRKNEDPSTSGKRTDFLQLLLNAESSEGDEILNGNGVHKKVVKRLSSDEVIGQAFLFFLAGYETTANTLHFVSYVLVKYPDIQDRLIQEIEEHIGDEEPTYENVSKLTYMEQVILETLRMYPPVSLVNRKSSANVTIKGVTIPEDMIVMIPIYTVHHNPENYPDPELFLPERFEASVKKDSNPVTFLPFGFGPRLCIGMRLALVEAKIALVYTLRKVRFVKCPQTPEQLEFKNAGILSPKAPIIVAVEEINN